MNIQETAALCAFVKVLVPAQAFEEGTPAIWHVVLGEVPFEDAKTAALALARTHSFIGPSDVVGQVKVLRKARLDRQLPAPNVDPADALTYLEEERAIRDAVADGAMGDDEIADYERGGRTLTGAAPRYALDAPMVTRAEIASRFGSVFRDARGRRPAIEEVKKRKKAPPPQAPADGLAPAPWDEEGAS